MSSLPSRLLSAATFLVASLVPAAAQFLQNPGFDGPPYFYWTAGQNVFEGAPPTWRRFESIAVDETVTKSGSTITFASADPGYGDYLERFLLQEWSAISGITPFNTGDVIRFRGRARATKTGNNTSDMIVRASIRTLGYINNLSFQLKAEYTAHANIGSEWADFDISITFPNLRTDDSLQRVAMGFEISGYYDPVGNALDTASIEFQNLVGTVTPAGGGATKYLGIDIVGTAPKTVDTGSWLGLLAVDNVPFVYSYKLGRWVYLDENQDLSGGAWMHLARAGGLTTTGGPTKYLGFDIVPGSPKTVDTGTWLGVIAIDNAPFVYSYKLNRWVFLDDTQSLTEGAWVHVFKDAPAAAAP